MRFWFFAVGRGKEEGREKAKSDERSDDRRRRARARWAVVEARKEARRCKMEVDLKEMTDPTDLPEHPGVERAIELLDEVSGIDLQKDVKELKTQSKKWQVRLSAPAGRRGDERLRINLPPPLRTHGSARLCSPSLFPSPRVKEEDIR